MKIGVVTTSYPRYAGDPAGSFVAEHVAALRTAGHDIEVIAAGDVRINARAESEVQRIPSRLFYRGGAPDVLEAEGSLGAAAMFTVRLGARVVHRARFWDLIVAHWLTPSAIAALPTRVPLLAIAHGGDVYTLARLHLLGPVLFMLRARRAKLVFVGADLLTLARRYGRINDSDAIVQPMGIDLQRFASFQHRPTEPPTVLVVARLVPIKGVDVAVAAMRLVKRVGRLVIAGDGPERTSLARSCAGSDRVVMLGAIDTAERDRWLGCASVVVVPSRVLESGRTEGAPMVILEALAAGVPVIASAVGGSGSLSGVTRVPPDDPAALAAAIDRALATRPQQRPLQATVADYDWPTVTARLMTHACVAGFAPRSDPFFSNRL